MCREKACVFFASSYSLRSLQTVIRGSYVVRSKQRHQVLSKVVYKCRDVRVFKRQANDVIRKVVHRLSLLPVSVVSTTVVSVVFHLHLDTLFAHGGKWRETF